MGLVIEDFFLKCSCSSQCRCKIVLNDQILIIFFVQISVGLSVRSFELLVLQNKDIRDVVMPIDSRGIECNHVTCDQMQMTPPVQHELIPLFDDNVSKILLPKKIVLCVPFPRQRDMVCPSGCTKLLHMKVCVIIINRSECSRDPQMFLYFVESKENHAPRTFQNPGSHFLMVLQTPIRLCTRIT
jgi:hypothetical protein